jgi:hypothetical protein
MFYSLILITFRTNLPALSSSLPIHGVGNGIDPSLSSFPCAGTGDKRQPIHRSFSYHTCFTTLSNNLRNGFGEFSCVMGPPLYLVLANTRVGTADIGQPLQKALVYLPLCPLLNLS